MFKILYLLIGLIAFGAVASGVYKVSDYYANVIETNLIKEAKLYDSHGHHWQISELKEKIGIIYFGYTSCPDICPNALNNLSITLANMGEDSKIFQPIFVSVDPNRDTSEVIEEYTKHFGDNILGLTGTDTQLKVFSWIFGASYSLRTPENKNQEYIVDHSANYFLVTSLGRFLKLPVKDNPKDLGMLLMRSKSSILETM